jgi:hypothetical protein
MKLLSTFAIAVLCAGAWTATEGRRAIAADDREALLQADRAAFAARNSTVALKDDWLDPNFTWTDSSGNTRNKSQILQALKTKNGLPLEAGSAPGDRAATVNGQIGVIQENSGKLYLLRIWIHRGSRWQLLVYQAVMSGAPPSAEAGNGKCDNPCQTVPFEPKTDDERDVIHTYQAVERAVTAHDSAAWGSHIADEFFAVTSNSDRPLNKAARMAGLDNQKVAGIAPFPLVSARMFEFGDAMVMISRQQPEHGLPLHVTRIWFQRGGAWLEAYSYQTTIQAGKSAQPEL